MIWLRRFVFLPLNLCFEEFEVFPCGGNRVSRKKLRTGFLIVPVYVIGILTLLYNIIDRRARIIMHSCFQNSMVSSLLYPCSTTRQFFVIIRS